LNLVQSLQVPKVIPLGAFVVRFLNPIYLILFFCLAGCSGKFETTLLDKDGKNIRNGNGRSNAGTGKMLFEQKCSSGHLEASLSQRSATLINEKIVSVPAMGSLRVLS